MATRSTIAKEQADGSIQQIYCHWDGYISNNGELLYHHWRDPLKVQELIDLGDLSSLGTCLGEQHPFSPWGDGGVPAGPSDAGIREAYNRSRELGWCTFYGRDRGELGVSKRVFKDWQDYLDNHQWEEYDYVFRTDGQWWVSDHGRAWITLREAIERDVAEDAV